MLQPDPALRHKGSGVYAAQKLVFYLGTVSLKPFVPREYVLGPQRLNFVVKDKTSSSQSCESPFGWRQFSRMGKKSCGSPHMPAEEGVEGRKVMPSGRDRVKNEIFPARYSSMFVTTKNACGHKPSLLPGTCEGRTVHQRCLLLSVPLETPRALPGKTRVW